MSFDEFRELGIRIYPSVPGEVILDSSNRFGDWKYFGVEFSALLACLGSEWSEADSFPYSESAVCIAWEEGAWCM